MGTRKKHHFVPRFYLKRFSIKYEGKQIGLFNHKSGIFIQNAPIKHQACEDFLYGRDDEIEIELAKLENSIAKLFYFWTDEKILIPPPQNTNGLNILKRFILYQLFRTPKAGDYIMKSIQTAFGEIIKQYYPEKEKDFQQGKLVHEDPVLLALLNSADKEKYLNFLDCKFIVNLSDLPFITSDAPVILYNQYMEKMGKNTGATGLVAKGLQIFYPIHPRLMICLYDPLVYTYGETENCIDTKLVDDIHQLNVLQYLNSDSQLFFDDAIVEHYLVNIVENYSYLKDKFGPISEIINTDKNKSLLYSSFEYPHIDLSLTFIKHTPTAEMVNFPFIPLRHPSFIRE